MQILIILLASTLIISCNLDRSSENINSVSVNTDTVINGVEASNNLTVETAQPILYKTGPINTGSTSPEALIEFAKTLQGIPYKYGSIDPAVGFDCSGFITYVFNHFNIAVPRSSVDFTNEGKEVPLSEAKPGDIVLFTGTDSNIHVVGHMGVITSKENDGYQFIHSTSGKADGVTITPLNRYYVGRFVKVIRIFKQNDNN